MKRALTSPCLLTILINKNRNVHSLLHGLPLPLDYAHACTHSTEIRALYISAVQHYNISFFLFPQFIKTNYIQLSRYLAVYT